MDEIIQPSIGYRGIITIHSASIHLEWSHYKARDKFLHTCMGNYCINACLCISLKHSDVWDIASVVDVTMKKNTQTVTRIFWLFHFLTMANSSWECFLPIPDRYFLKAKWPLEIIVVHSYIDGLVRDCSVSYTRVCETSSGCLRSIYPSLGMRQLFDDVL